jgi:hypothetical protein
VRSQIGSGELFHPYQQEGASMDWELWWQITIWIVLIAFCIIVIKGADRGK